MFQVDVVLPRHASGFEIPARIRFRLHDGEVVIMADPNKGEPDEMPSLFWIEDFENTLKKKNIQHEALLRSTDSGHRRDALRIPVEHLRTGNGRDLHPFLPLEMCANLRLH